MINSSEVAVGRTSQERFSSVKEGLYDCRLWGGAYVAIDCAAEHHRYNSTAEMVPVSSLVMKCLPDCRGQLC